VNTLPFNAFFAVGAILSGGLIGKTGMMKPYQITSGLLATIGAALLYTLEIDSSKARYIGPQVIFGLGIGLGNQIPMMTMQSFSTPETVAPVTGVMLSVYRFLLLEKLVTDRRSSVQFYQWCLLRHSSTIDLCKPFTANNRRLLA
jgi:hypothetical protein